MKSRLHALCPYFAMFPESFAADHIAAYTSDGDYVLDPFSGRGTTLLQALLMGRKAAAADINPVAYCISGAKAHVPTHTRIFGRLSRLHLDYATSDKTVLAGQRRALPPFFRRAFHHATLDELLFLQGTLKWRTSGVDRFITGLILGTLHGEMNKSRRYLSNQMPRTISPKPAYSLAYWQKHGLWAKKKNVFRRLKEETIFRLSGAVPEGRGDVIMTDVRAVGRRLRSLHGKVSAVITSPPYFDTTSCEEDQWLRLWFLGGEPRPTYGKISRDDRYASKDRYWHFLRQAWAGISPLVRPDAVLVCRIGGKDMDEAEITRGLTSSIERSFPSASLITKPSPSKLDKRQTPTFRPGSLGRRFEIDYVFKLGGRTSSNRPGSNGASASPTLPSTTA